MAKVPLTLGQFPGVVHQMERMAFRVGCGDQKNPDGVKGWEPGELYIMALYESRSEWSRAIHRAQGTSGGFCIITHYVTKA
jgi:hypothetical protein